MTNVMWFYCSHCGFCQQEPGYCTKCLVEGEGNRMSMAVLSPHRIQPHAEAQIVHWLKTRGGIAIWNSANLSNLGASWTCPVLGEDGKPAPKPSWQAGRIIRTITDSNDVIVEIPKEVKRFHVAIRRGSQGMSLKCTDASTRKIRTACAKAGDESWYEFDYMTQEAVIYVAAETRPLNMSIGDPQ